MKRTNTSMKFAMVGTTLIVVYSDAPPSDVDYDECLAFIRANERSMTGAIVYSAGSGPTKSTQRHAAARVWKESTSKPKVAVLTSSAFVRGMFTAVAWMIEEQIGAFAPQDLHRAIQYTNASDGPVRMVITRFCGELGISVPWPNGIAA